MMEVPIVEAGKTVRLTVMEYALGRKVMGNTQAAGIMDSKFKVFIHGQVETPTKACGVLENATV